MTSRKSIMGHKSKSNSVQPGNANHSVTDTQSPDSSESEESVQHTPQAREIALLFLIVVVFLVGFYGIMGNFIAHPKHVSGALPGTLLTWLSVIGGTCLLMKSPSGFMRHRNAVIRQHLRESPAFRYFTVLFMMPLLLGTALFVAYGAWIAGIPAISSFFVQDRGSIVFAVTRKPQKYQDADESCPGKIYVNNKAFLLNKLCRLPHRVWDTLRTGEWIRVSGPIGFGPTGPAGIRVEEICKAGSDRKCVSESDAQQETQPAST